MSPVDRTSVTFFTRVPLQYWSRGVAAIIGIACLAIANDAQKANQPLTLLIALASFVIATACWLKSEQGRIASIGWMAWQRLAAALFMLFVIESGYRIHDAWGPLSDPAAQESAAREAKVVSFTEAQGDPVAFLKWWDLYVGEWYRNADLIQHWTPDTPVPYVFKPNTSRSFFRGQININSLGLCDREVPVEKGNHYRIVVMGSSHTQCPPIEADEKSWPARLQDLIESRVTTSRPVEVLNAGASAYSMENNLHRLKTVVLPLKPDMIITYFGYNDYKLFQKEFPMPSYPPQLAQRASKLLGKVEFRYKTWNSERLADNGSLPDLEPLLPRLEQCRIADLYRKYLKITRDAGIQLVVCNFCMAVDEHSPREVVDFYGQGFTHVKFMIAANRLNSAILPLVVRPETGARLIDVQSRLNGAWEGPYVDLVHFSDIGKVQLAENVFGGIVDLLPVISSPAQRGDVVPAAFASDTLVDPY